MLRIIFYSLLIVILLSCGQDNHQTKNSISEMITQTEKIISRNGKIPSRILEAHLIEFQYGDGRLGPSDFTLYLRIKTNKYETNKWISGLEKPFNNSGVYSKPNTNETWWISETNFLNLEKYETKTLFGRVNGRMCIDEELGFIYVYTYTM